MEEYYVLLGVDFDDQLNAFIYQNKDQQWVGVDRGAYYLIQHDISPCLSVGDFDSVTEQEQKKIQAQSKRFIKLPVDKDDTDTEWAVKEIFRQHPKAHIHLFSESTSRLDHFLNTLMMPAKEEFRPYAEQISYHNHNNTISYLLPGEHILRQESDKDLVAFASLVETKQVTLVDFQYPLSHHDMGPGVVYTSNRFINETGRVSFDSGLLMVIQSKNN